MTRLFLCYTFLMHIRAFERRGARKAWPVYLANLFFSLSYALILYINSSFLGKFFSPKDVSLLFVFAALGNIVFFFIAPLLLRSIGNTRTLVFFLLLQYAGLAGLIVSTSSFAIAASFFLYGSTAMMVFYSLDIFIEGISSDARTGEIRGITLTLDNLSVAIAPLLISVLAFDGQFKLAYFASSLLILPVIFIAFFCLKKFGPGHEKSHSIGLPFLEWWKRAEPRRATIARFVLELFYAVMVIFVPLYLSISIGFSWPVIGVIFSFMLLPFVLFELPAGELADHWCGEREIMTLGFFIIGLSLLSMPFLGTSAPVWAIVLFISRVGAAFVEVTSEVHFFRHAHKDDTGLISIFRLTRPTAIAAGALVGGTLLSRYSFSALFFCLALVVLLGMHESARLKDRL
ncbi:MAG: major facilitator superfamily transporter [Parcubacteria group bacterium]|nr:major facilitator superfamily transporter [Parcubacteria group bacterium]